MNLRRRNHYLAACLQNGFTDQTGKVWVKFADRAKPAHRTPQTVGRKRSLYIREFNGIEDDKVEKFFNQEIETPFANLVQRVKNEREEFENINTPEQAALLKFAASQAVRTLAHRRCIDTQAGQEVDQNTFIRVMFRQIYTMADTWGKNPPKLRFFTTLPLISDYFISGDHPVYVIHLNDNVVWTPTAEPKRQITQLSDLLNMPNVGFWLHLSPYIAVSVQPRDSAQTFLPPESIEPRQVRAMNELVRGQSNEFILARDKESLT
jgi:hypothetical protein